MAIEGQEVILYIKKVLIYSTRTTYRSAHDHPFIFSVVCFMLLLYRSFPSLFAFLVSSSPVLICTALLLGTLLSYGEPDIPEFEEEDKITQEISSLKVGSASSDLLVRKNECCMIESHVDNQREIEEMAVEEAVLGERVTSAHGKVEDDIPFATTHDEGDEKHDTLAASSSAKEDKKEIPGEEIMTEERELSEQEITKDKEFSVHNLDVIKVGQDVDGFSATDQKDIEGLKVEVHKPALDNYFDSPLGSPWQRIDNHDNHDYSLDSESDRAESSSPDASMADIIPMLDELHPLLDSETPWPALLSKGSKDGASQGSSHDHESYDGSMEEEAENQEEEEEEEAREERDDGAEAAVTWTADDQKNVMDLGSSELERNRRLESLIAKRRARKNMRSETERNLIDLDCIMGELSRFHFQIQPISAPRWNPFDLPYDSDESMGLPPIPGSAPPVLLPRRNPFDFPFDPVHESSSRAVETRRNRDFASDPQHNMFFRRNETFNLLDSELKQDKHESMLEPHFVVERISEEASSAAFQRQFSDKSDSKVSSVPESGTVSSVTDQEYHKELVEQELHQEGELLTPSEHDAEPAEQESQSSEEVESLDVAQEKNEINITNNHGIEIDANVAVDKTQPAEAFGAMEEEIRDEVDLSPTISAAEKLEVIEEKYEESSPSSSEEDEKTPRSNSHEQSANLDQTRDAMLAVGDSDCLNEGERFDDSHVADPIYDLSPLAISPSNISEASSDSGKGGPDVSSLKFEMQDMGSSPSPVETNVNSGVGSTGDLASSTGGLWVASSDLASEYELRSRDKTELREPDVTEGGSQLVHKDARDPIAQVLSESGATEIMCHSSLCSAEAESRKGGGIDMDVSLQTEGNKIIDNTTSSYSGSLLLSEHLSSSASEKAQPIENSGIQASSEVGQISVLHLPPIPEEKLDDYKPEEDHENSVKPESVACLTGLEILEEPNFVLSDIEQELSQLQRKSTEEIMDGNYRLAAEPEDVDSRVVTPAISIHDVSFTGLQLLEPKESMDFLSLSEAKSEFEIESGTVLTNSRDCIISAAEREGDGYSQQNINDSDEESDKVYPDLINIRQIDENLLSELDAVGDFHVEELRSDQQGLEIGQSDDVATSSLTSEIPEITSQLQVSEERSTEYADMSLSLPSEAKLNLSEELHSVIEQPKAMGSGVGPSLEPSFVDPEQMVYNPGLLEATSIEEIVAALKLLQEEAGPSSASEPLVSKLKTATSEVNASELVITERDPEITRTESELLIVEAKSVEDIHSALKKLSEENPGKSIIPEAGQYQMFPGGTHFGPMEIHSDQQVVEAKSYVDIHLDGISESPLEGTHFGLLIVETKSVEDTHSALKKLSEDNPGKSIIPEAGQYQMFPGGTHFGPMEIHSDLQVVEAKSLEDIHLAFKQASDGISESPPEVTKPSDGSKEVEISDRHLEPDVLEVHSAEEIESAFKEAVSKETGSSGQQNAGKSDDVEKMVDDSSSNVSTSKKAKKKNKSGKSGSSSSSSSSSSDSD